MRKGLIFASVALLLGMIPSLVKPEYSYLFGGLLAGLILSTLVFMPYWITWYYSYFVVTDQRLLQVSQKGLWRRSVVDIDLAQIQMVNYEVGGFEETMLGFGTIMMQTYVGDLIIHDVAHPAKIQKQVLTILREKGILSNPPPMTKDDNQPGHDDQKQGSEDQED